jgi:fluoroquinolone transport system ATP-binding protein
MSLDGSARRGSMHRPAQAGASPGVDGDVIAVRALTFTYPRAAEPALRGMDFGVGRGEIFGFLGPSGA